MRAPCEPHMLQARLVADLYRFAKVFWAASDSSKPATMNALSAIMEKCKNVVLETPSCMSGVACVMHDVDDCASLQSGPTGRSHIGMAAKVIVRMTGCDPVWREKFLADRHRGSLAAMTPAPYVSQGRASLLNATFPYWFLWRALSAYAVRVGQKPAKAGESLGRAAAGALGRSRSQQGGAFCVDSFEKVSDKFDQKRQAHSSTI